MHDYGNVAHLSELSRIEEQKQTIACILAHVLLAT